jgi:hypothetical protein
MRSKCRSWGVALKTSRVLDAFDSVAKNPLRRRLAVTTWARLRGRLVLICFYSMSSGSCPQLGHTPIAGPGKVTATGPDFITFSPLNNCIVVWDGKASAGFRQRFNAKSFASKIKDCGLPTAGAWCAEIYAAFVATGNSQILAAFNSRAIDPQFFRWRIGAGYVP